MRYTIVGNGVAGTTAALHIRKRDPEGEITIISDETLPFYSRIRLIEFLAGTAAEQDLVIFKDSWYERNRVNLMLGRTAASIAEKEGEIALDNGVIVPYDRLLLATGSRPAVPSVPGIAKQGVFTLRNIDDARRIISYIEDRERVILLGGGVLSIEVANALRTRGKAVTVSEVYPRLLPRQMDRQGSLVLQTMIKKKGIAFQLGTGVREIIGKLRAEGVILEDGTRIEGDAFIIAAGVKPSAALVTPHGLSCTGGIPVDDRMKTSVPNVYAAGDGASHRGICYGIWAAAEKQGEIAGINMAGGDARYEGTLPSHMLKVAGIQLLSAGDIDPEDRFASRVRSDPDHGIYRKLVSHEGRLIGCILLGDLSGKQEILAALAKGSPLDTLGDALIN